MASDSIRLYQRFIELHKKNFWISLYPLERPRDLMSIGSCLSGPYYNFQ
jgi:hypothetical protein